MMRKTLITLVAVLAASPAGAGPLVTALPRIAAPHTAAEMTARPVDRSGHSFTNLPGAPFDRSSAYCPYAGARLETRAFGEMVCVLPQSGPISGEKG